MLFILYSFSSDTFTESEFPLVMSPKAVPNLSIAANAPVARIDTLSAAAISVTAILRFF